MAFSIQPTCLILPRIQSQRRIVAPFWIPKTTRLSKSDLAGEVLFKKGDSGWIGSWGFCEKLCSSCSRRRTGMARLAAFRGGAEDDGEMRVQVFEQEGLIDGESSELRIVTGGLEATLNRLSKWLVSAVFGAVVLWRHDAEALWLVSGSVVNTIISTILKRILNQERPASTPKSDPGMPSSHAQSIFFAIAFLIISMMEWLGVNALTLVLSSIFVAFGSYLSWLRVSQQFHTLSQVLVGAILGSAFSVLWFWSWSAFVHEAYNSLLWVQIFVILTAAGFAVGFLLYVVRNWLKDDS